MEDQERTREAATGTQSLDRAVLLLHEIGTHGERGARLTDLVADTGLTKGTVRRLLGALLRHGLLEQDERSRRYFLGAETFVLGRLAATRVAGREMPPATDGRLAAAAMAKFAGGAIPLAELLCDRHAETHRARSLALIHENAAGRSARLSYEELRQHSRRFASVLRQLGVGKGDHVATLLAKGPEFLIAALAAWRLGAVLVPLFTAFGSAAIGYRLAHSEARVIVSNGMCRGKIATEAAGPARVVMVESDGAAAQPEDVPFWSTLHAAEPLAAGTPLAGDDPFVLIYSAGTTRTPRGIIVPVRALACIEQYMRRGIDFRDDDVYWNMGDPGWAGGLYYAVLGPLLLGSTIIFCDGPFDAGQVYRVLLKYGVTNLQGPPHWYRTLREADRETPPPTGLRLRVVSSMGEPLPGEIVAWARERLGVALLNHYGQAELGVVICEQQAAAEGVEGGRREGASGALAGMRLVVLDPAGSELPAGAQGELAIDTEKSPLFWFEGYFRNDEARRERFRFGRRYYCTGDLFRSDRAGGFRYLGPAADAITASGYVIGPVEVETALHAHAAVAEAAVIGQPDRLRGEIVKAFVVLKPGIAGSPELAHEIGGFARDRLADHPHPPEVEFVAALPRTGTGGLQRARLREGGQ